MEQFSKYFKNGKTFSSFCRMRYGQSKLVWEDTSLWKKTGEYTIALDLEAADKKFLPDGEPPIMTKEDQDRQLADELSK